MDFGYARSGLLNLINSALCNVACFSDTLYLFPITMVYTLNSGVLYKRSTASANSSIICTTIGTEYRSGRYQSTSHLAITPYHREHVEFKYIRQSVCAAFASLYTARGASEILTLSHSTDILNHYIYYLGVPYI